MEACVSATNRGAIRVEHDFYSTPAWCVKAISERINWALVGSACEPCRGDGAIIRGCQSLVDWECFEIREGWDYFKALPKSCDLTITNPPYNAAADFLAKSLGHSLCVSYLLRINFLGSAKRKAFLSANRPTHEYVLTERPSFVDVCAGFEKTKERDRIKGCGLSFHKDAKIKICDGCGGKVKAGTDATEYAWFCWDKGGIMLDAPGIYFL